jgi:hypothetical protein
MTQLTHSKSAAPLPRAELVDFRALGDRVRRLQSILRTTPGQLRLAMVGIWLLVLLFAWATWFALDRHRLDMQTIGRDTAPSIIAAESIKWNFADLHTNVIRRFLDSPDRSADAAHACGELRESVTRQLLTAAENITYGDAERAPIRDLMNGLSRYDSAVAQAIVLHDRRDGSDLKHIRDAEKIAHETIIPAAEALDLENQSALNDGYNAQQTEADHTTALLIFSCVLLLAGLAGTQILLQRRMHRRISPALVVAALLSIAWTCWIVTALSDETHDLKVAKQDAFDSIGVMWRARADAFTAQSHLGLSLLDPAVSQSAQQAFDQETSQLVTLSDGVTFEQVQSATTAGQLPPSGFQGYIGVELRNITFDGELDAANQMLASYAHYIGITKQVRDAQSTGDLPRAIALCLGDNTNQARGALKAFDDALDKVLQINQDAFDQAVNRGFEDVAGFGVWNIAVALLIAITAQFGLSQRLREYAV